MKALTIYVPMNHSASNKWLQTTEREMARIFGGFTSSVAKGGWLNSSQVLVHDSIVAVQSFEQQPNQVDRYLVELTALCQHMRYELKQDSVAVTVTDGIMLLI